MTKVISIRMPSILERAVRTQAARSNMLVADIVRLILMHAPGGQFSFFLNCQTFNNTSTPSSMSGCLKSLFPSFVGNRRG